MTEALVPRLQRIRLVLLDVDGVLTDGRLHYGASGDEGRSFHVRDGSAIKLARDGHLNVGLLSGRRLEAVERRALELGMTEIHQGHRVKEPVWEEILARLDLTDEEVAYVGDDFLDLPLLRRAGFAAAPADASPEVLAVAHWTASRPGGHGCVREVLELVLRAQGRWDDLVEKTIDPGRSGPGASATR